MRIGYGKPAQGLGIENWEFVWGKEMEKRAGEPVWGMGEGEPVWGLGTCTGSGNWERAQDLGIWKLCWDCEAMWELRQLARQ